MTTEAMFFVAAACYVCCSLAGIRLRDGVVVPTAAAFAPATAMLGFESDLHVGFALLGPALGVFVAQLATRAGGSPAVGHGALYLLVGALMWFAGTGAASDSALALGSLLSLTAIYSIGEVFRQRLLGEAWISSDRSTWVLLQGVLLSGCGLILLVVERLGAVSLIAMLLVLILTRKEFEDLARARTALTQTVRSLEDLARATVD